MRAFVAQAFLPVLLTAGRGRRGQATVEYAITFAAIIMPLTAAMIFTAQLLWIWHSVVDFTRDGARYATTHCWQASGDNVISYMRTHVPAMIDGDQFQQGGAELAIEYFSRSAETGALESFACEGGECNAACVPDAVTVRVRNYEFRRFVSYLGLPPIPLPDFHTSLPMESAGCNPEQSECLP
jgi:hypothetical protein